MKTKKRIIVNVIMVTLVAGLCVALIFSTGIVKTGGMHGQGKSLGQPSQSSQQQAGSSNAQQQPPGSGNNSKSPGGSPNGQHNSGSFGTMRYVLIGGESMLLVLLITYLIMSGFNRKTARETLPDKKKIAVLIVVTVLAGGAVSAAGTIIPMKLMGNSGHSKQQSTAKTVSASGETEVSGKTATLNGNYTSTKSDQNVVLVKNGGTLTSSGAVINKKSGNGTNTENCDFYGINAGLLVNGKSTANVKKATISTSANRSNAVFVTGEGSSLNISDSTITTSGKSSCRGLDATYGGKINASNVKITTKGGSCAALATDRGGGTVKATSSKLTTNGTGSPLIYSTGKICVIKTTGTANGSQIAVVEGKNSVNVTNSSLTASAAGNRGNVDVCGIMLYQSMSGDAGQGTSSFTAKKSSLSINKNSKYYDSAPMFFVTNTSSVIKLSKTTLNYGSGILLSAKGTSAWGNSGSNGGKVKLIASDQTLNGNIVLDKLSTLSMKLTDGSTYTGTLNGNKKAKSVKLSLSKDSKIKLTGDSYVTSLNDEDSSYSNINLNGHKLYVNGTSLEK